MSRAALAVAACLAFGCADAAVDLLHLPYEFWSLGLYVFVAVAALWALRSRSA